MAALAEHPWAFLAVVAIGFMVSLLMSLAERRWNRPVQPLPPPRYRRKPRIAGRRP